MTVKNVNTSNAHTKCVGTICFNIISCIFYFYGISPYGTSPSTNALLSYNIPSKSLLLGFMKLILSVSVESRTAS